MHLMLTSYETKKQIIVGMLNIEAVVEGPERADETPGSVIKLVSGFDIEVIESVDDICEMFCMEDLLGKGKPKAKSKLKKA